MRKINEIIIHCTATPASRDVTVEQIRDFHVKGNGWADIGYHYIIYRNGEIHVGRPPEQPGAHCKGHNANSIGIAYVGGLLDDGRTPADTRTTEQKTALIALINRLRQIYPDARVRFHRDFARKACPCFNATKEYSALITAIIILVSAFATSCRSQKHMTSNDTEIMTIEKILTVTSRHDSSELLIDINLDSIQVATFGHNNKRMTTIMAKKAAIGIRRKSETDVSITSATVDSATVTDRRKTTTTTGQKHQFPTLTAILTVIALVAIMLRIGIGRRT